jgi:DNA-binding CsgD family transcriptional regulator
MTEFEGNALSDLVGHIYEAAYDADHWDELVGLIERIHPGARVTLFGHGNGSPTATLGAHRNYNPADLDAYRQYYIRCSPFMLRSARFPVGRAYRYEIAIGDAELEKTEYYNDYMRPRRLGHYGTGLIIERDRPGLGARGTVLSLADHDNDEARRERQLRLLDLLQPHLKRALQLRSMLTAERLGASAVHAAFDRWTHAAIVLNAQAQVVAFNAAAQQLFDRADGVWLGRRGGLCSGDEVTVKALDATVRKCAALSGVADANAPVPEIETVVLPRAGGPPLRAMAWPLPFLSGAAAPNGGAVLLVVLDSSQARRTPVDWVARQYGLTPAETRLLEALVNGVPLAEAAEQLGIRISTARTRLKMIQHKTDCRRQADLVRLALSVPMLNGA